jgi:hypothetical protein
LAAKDFQAKEPLVLRLENARDVAIDVAVVDGDDKKLAVAVHERFIGGDALVRVSPPRNLKPGKYTLRVVGPKGRISEQDFTWGVLAINTNKSIYLPNEEAGLAMAVLDDEGKMVCDARLRLEIRAPGGEAAVLSTEDGTIRVNRECRVHDFTVKPDYEASYRVGGAGSYRMELSAETKNGHFQVSDVFEVDDSVPFEIERDSATRLYPPKEYPVAFTIVAHQDFTGKVIETVPESFEVSGVEAKTVSLIKTAGADKGAVQRRHREFDLLPPPGKVKEITWEVSVKKGETIHLGYRFKAPDVSPQFYLLGPLRLREKGGGEIFRERRQWQLAADQISTFRMEVRKFTDIGTSWSSKTFLNTYVSPVVIVSAEPNSAWTANDPPFGVNIKNVTSTGVDVRITIPDRQYGSGTMPADNTVYMLVVEEGYWDANDVPGLFKIEAQKFTSSGVNANSYKDIASNSVQRSLNAGWGSTAHHYFTNAALDNEDAWIEVGMWGSASAGSPPTPTQTSGIYVGLSSAEVTPQDNHLDETIYFVVVEDGSHSFDGRSFRADRTPDDVEEYAHSSNPDPHSFGSAPAWGVSDLVAMDGTNGGWGNWENSPFDTVNVTPYDQEDRYQDSETNHISEEFDWFIADASNWSFEQGLGVVQAHYHWRHDDGSEATATSATGGIQDTPLSGLGKESNIRLRLEVSNEGATSDVSSYRLEYGQKTTTCAAVSAWSDVGGAGGDWDMADSANLTDGDDTTNISLATGGVTDENTTFKTPNGGVKDVSSQTGSISLSTSEFVELEYAVKALPAVAAGTTYCFRVTDGGAALDNYSVYPEVTIKSSTLAVGEYGRVDLTNNNWTTVNLDNTYENLVVVASARYSPSGDGQRAPRVRNKTSTSFQIKVDNEAANFTGTTPVDWIAMEAGSFSIPNGSGTTKVIAGTVSTNGTFCNSDQITGTPATVAFSPNFDGSPAVLATVASDGDPAWAVTHIDDGAVIDNEPTAAQMRLMLNVSFVSCSTPHGAEDIDYLAFDSGHGANNGVDFDAAISTDSINCCGNGDPISFTSAFSSAPEVAVVQQMGEDGGNGGYAVSYAGTPTTTTTHYASIDEDGPNADRSHTQEVAAVIAFDAASGTIVTNIGYTESAYRWYENDDSTGVGAPLAAQDSGAILPNDGQSFRLRALIHVDEEDVHQGGGKFKLQFAERSGTCDPGFAGESYVDVTATTAVAYKDNSPGDGEALTPGPNDPAHGGDVVRGETYEEANDFSNAQSRVAAGEDGMWDFALVDYAAPRGAVYCFRMVSAGGTTLDTYSVIPEITIGVPLERLMRHGKWFDDAGSEKPFTM